MQRTAGMVLRPSDSALAMRCIPSITVPSGLRITGHVKKAVSWVYLLAALLAATVVRTLPSPTPTNVYRALN